MRNRKTKWAALIIAIIISLLLIPDVPYHSVGIYKDCPFINRLTYHFFHANIIHLVLNIWCFLHCVFLCNIGIGRWLTAFIIASAAPCLDTTPAIGLSGICFAFLGMLSLHVPNKRQYHTYIILCLSIQLLLAPHAIAVALHTWCYLAAIITEYAYAKFIIHN